MTPADSAGASPLLAWAAWLIPDSRRRRLALALGVYVACAIVFFACAPRQLLTEHTSYNHYALLAESWLHGRLDLGHPPPAYTQNNDFAEFNGRWFVAFPAFPALLLVPLMKIAGSAENLRDGQIWLWFAGAGPAVLFLVLEKLRRMGESACSERVNLSLALIFAFGTVYFFTAEQGTVWFSAHVVAVLLLALFLLFALGTERPVLAGLCTGFLFQTRPHVLLVGSIFFALETWRTTWKGSLAQTDVRAALKKLTLFAAPVAVVLGLSLWHNYVRFQTAGFGYEHLAIGWHARIVKWGMFSYHFMGKNLGIMTSNLPYWNKTDPHIQINTHGLALWITTPVYLWLIWPRRVSFLWKALAISAAPAVLANLAYQNSGWLQFGYRFSNDYSVFLFALLAVGGYRFGRLFYTCAAWSVAVNAFGALTFERRGFEKFYFTDNSQTIVYQPD